MDDLYRRLFDVIPGYVSVQDRKLRIIAANEMFREDFGGEVGAYCYEVYKDRADRCPVCPVAETFADGRVHSSEEVVFSRRDQADKSVIVYTAPVWNGRGEIEAVVELSTDITEIKRLQQRYRLLFEAVPCYISVQNRDLRIQEANQNFKDDFGEEIGEYCYRAYKHRTEPCLVCPVAKTFADGQVHTSEEVVTARHGKQANVLVSAAPLRSMDGEIEAVMEMSTNITALRDVQSQLASLGMLLGSVAHGIKGLLSGLDGGVYLMETGFEKNKPERIHQGRQMVKRNVDRIRNMVLNLLYYAKDREVDHQAIDLQEMVTSVANVVDSRAERLGVTIEVGAGPGAASGDHDAVHSMLLNLVENAIDACRNDKKEVTHVVSLAARVDGEHAVFEIADNGIGMDQETREKAFSLFFSSKGAEGTGLGLFIAAKIVKAHGGRIEIDSTPGEGTRFTVTLPAAKETD